MQAAHYVAQSELYHMMCTAGADTYDVPWNLPPAELNCK